VPSFRVKKDIPYVLGWSAGHHDAAIALVQQRIRYSGANPKNLWKETTLVKADHSERWSRKKNDPDLCDELLDWVLAPLSGQKIVLVAHQRWWNLRAGGIARSAEEIYRWYGNLLKIRRACRRHGVEISKETQVSHHLSHAWAAWGTSRLTRATVVTIDAIGERDTICSFRGGSGPSGKLKQYDYLWRYPKSLGLFYSSWTQYLGFKPNEEEYHVMALAGLGQQLVSNSEEYNQLYQRLFDILWYSGLESYHRGVPKMNRVDVDRIIVNDSDHKVLAYTVQSVYECYLQEILLKIPPVNGHYLLSGGCALNCLANKNIASEYGEAFSNPGDAGSSLGAALAYLQTKLTYPYDPCVGYGKDNSLAGKSFLIAQALQALKEKGLVALCIGRSEFGPRALGNRSLIARADYPKEKLDALKERASYRPYGCVVDLKSVPELFINGGRYRPMPYMNTLLELKPEYQKRYPTVVHVDSTSRVQTIDLSTALSSYWKGPEFLQVLLSMWSGDTGQELLLNTSLNKKGHPLARTVSDIEDWCRTNDVPLITDQ
jgi:carbamoyltransferase